MAEKEATAIMRLGDVILWLGTAALIVCIAVSALNAYWYIIGTPSYVDQKAVFLVTTSDNQKFRISIPKRGAAPDVLAWLKNVSELLEKERSGTLTLDDRHAVESARLRGELPDAQVSSKLLDALSSTVGDPKIDQIQEAERLLTTYHSSEDKLRSLLFAGGGIFSWLVLASIAYIFNGRSPVAVIRGIFRRA